MASKYREEPFECTYCEICRRQFATRELFEIGCQRCAPIVAAPKKPKAPREWFDQE